MNKLLYFINFEAITNFRMCSSGRHCWLPTQLSPWFPLHPITWGCLGEQRVKNIRDKFLFQLGVDRSFDSSQWNINRGILLDRFLYFFFFWLRGKKEKDTQKVHYSPPVPLSFQILAGIVENIVLRPMPAILSSS